MRRTNLRFDLLQLGQHVDVLDNNDVLSEARLIGATGPRGCCRHSCSFVIPNADAAVHDAKYLPDDPSELPTEPPTEPADTGGGALQRNGNTATARISGAQRGGNPQWNKNNTKQGQVEKLLTRRSVTNLWHSDTKRKYKAQHPRQSASINNKQHTAGSSRSYPPRNRRRNPSWAQARKWRAVREGLKVQQKSRLLQQLNYQHQHQRRVHLQI